MAEKNVEGPRIQGQFKGATTDIDRRHGDPEFGGLSSGEKAAITRSMRYGDELTFEKDASPEKKEAILRFRQEQAGKATPENEDARADDPLSNPKNAAAQGNA
ncbi:28S ribosomal [Micractinium conductrix]|uniref:28S ribosomal n=1 Tax=Micractinium conductrix TaxID=554055 RepID=A0A2P6VDW4_9CHLO|nr:28S ribosomal [Micractinium conductrix]|eukprot:PSC72267.1 28S ribosomal [Micractinium conductrix]